MNKNRLLLICLLALYTEYSDWDKFVFMWQLVNLVANTLNWLAVAAWWDIPCLFCNWISILFLSESCRSRRLWRREIWAAWISEESSPMLSSSPWFLMEGKLLFLCCMVIKKMPSWFACNVITRALCNNKIDFCFGINLPYLAYSLVTWNVICWFIWNNMAI